MDKDFSITISAESGPLKAEVAKAVAEVNRLQAAVEFRRVSGDRMAAWGRQMALLARAQRDEAAKQVPVEQQLVRLYAERARIAERMQRYAGNEYRMRALGLMQARNEAGIAAARAQVYAGAGMGLGEAAAAGAAGGGLMARMGGGLMRVFGLTGLAVTGVAMARGMSRAAMEYAGRITDLSERFGMSTEILQQLDYAASLTGSSLDQVVVGMRNLQMSQAKAVAGAKEDAEAFARMGIGLADLKRLRPEELFMRVARSVREMPANAQQLTDVMAIFGRSGDELLPALKSGFDELAGKAKELNVLLSKETLAKLDDAGDKWTVFVTMVRAATSQLLVWAMEAANKVMTLAGMLSRWIPVLGGGPMGAWVALYEKVMKQVEAGLPEKPPGAQKVMAPLEEAAAEAKTKKGLSLEHLGSPAADVLARIGLFRGGVDRQLAVQQRQLDRLEQMVTELRQVNRNLTAEV